MKTLSFLLLLSTVFVACNDNVSLKHEQPGSIVDVTRDTEKYIVKLNKDGEWKIFQGPSIEQISWDNPTHLQGGDSLIIYHTYPNSRIYFAVESLKDGDTLYASERQIPIEGALNFRDFGGFINKDGKQLRWGKLFRSGSLENLTDDDLIYFKNLGIKTVIDLRSEKGIQDALDRLPDSVQWMHVKIIKTADLKRTIADNTDMSPESAVHFLEQNYKDFIANINTFKPIIEELLKGKPLLLHCNSGKDRSGISVALILMALNVDRSVIENNYLLTNQYTPLYYKDNKKKLQPLGINDDVTMELSRVRAEYLQAAFSAIDSTYGSSEKMFEEEFGITAKKQKELIKAYTY